MMATTYTDRFMGLTGRPKSNRELVREVVRLIKEQPNLLLEITPDFDHEQEWWTRAMCEGERY